MAREQHCCVCGKFRGDREALSWTKYGELHTDMFAPSGSWIAFGEKQVLCSICVDVFFQTVLGSSLSLAAQLKHEAVNETMAAMSLGRRILPFVTGDLSRLMPTALRERLMRVRELVEKVTRPD